MSNLVVPIAKIDKIKPHPNADKMEICEILGWQLCIAKDNSYKEGDLVVYVPPDSVLPQELSDSLNVTQYLSKGRVRAIKLRGEPSYGLTIPISKLGEFTPEILHGMGRDFDGQIVWREGDDVADIFGITKHEPPYRPGPGDADKDDARFPKYTEIENLRNYPYILQDGEEVVITEKIHGSNVRVAIIEGEFFAGSKSLNRKKPENWEKSLYWMPLAVPEVVSLLEDLATDHNQVVLYGEIYGSRIQNLDYGEKEKIGFIAFDLMVDGTFVDYNEFLRLTIRHNVPTVPELYKGPYSLSVVKEHAQGKTLLDAPHIREGVVVKPVVERTDPKIGRVVLKFLSDEYLTGKYTDFTDT